MNFSWWTFVLQAANFLILVFLLERFLFRPVKAIVARRKEAISHALAEASVEKEAAERLKQELESNKSQVDAERQKILGDGRAQLTAERQRMLEETRHEAEEIRAQTLKLLDQERTAASKELFERTIALAAKLAERLLSELALPSTERPFFAQATSYLDRLTAEEKSKLLSDGAEGLLVTTAHPLDVQEQAQWREQLAKRLGTEFSIKFGVDPGLIAGTVITFPHAILRFNWRDSLATAVGEFHAGEPSR